MFNEEFYYCFRCITSERSPTLMPKRSPSVSTNDDTTTSGNEDNSRRESVNFKDNRTNSAPEVPLLPDGTIDFDG